MDHDMKLCGCRQCLRDRNEGKTFADGTFLKEELTRMVLCLKCGNKRCPHATDHRYACAGSNLPGKKGSVYEDFNGKGEQPAANELNKG